MGMQRFKREPLSGRFCVRTTNAQGTRCPTRRGLKVKICSVVTCVHMRPEAPANGQRPRDLRLSTEYLLSWCCVHCCGNDMRLVNTSKTDSSTKRTGHKHAPVILHLASSVSSHHAELQGSSVPYCCTFQHNFNSPRMKNVRKRRRLVLGGGTATGTRAPIARRAYIGTTVRLRCE